MRLEIFVNGESHTRGRGGRQTVTRVEAMIRPWAVPGDYEDAYRAIRKVLRDGIDHCESSMRKVDLEADFAKEINFTETSYPVPTAVIAMCAKRMLDMTLDLNGPSSSVPFYIVARDVELIARAVLKLIPEKIKK